MDPQGKGGLKGFLHLLLFTRRGQFALCAHLMLFQAYAIRTVMSVAVGGISKEFNYDDSQQGLILSAFFIGYIFPQIPAGTLATIYGGKTILTLGILLPSLLTAITPLVASNYTLLVGLRVLTGLTEGVTYPALHALLGKWVPSGERSMLLNTMWSGAFMGTALTLPAAGAFCGGSWGWRGAFYFFSAFGLTISALFFAVTTSSPETHPWASPEEVAYIVAHRGGHGKSSSSSSSSSSSLEMEDKAPLLEEGEKDAGGRGGGGGEGGEKEEEEAASFSSIAWGRILTCPPILACFVLHTTHNWTYYLLLTWLPNYLNRRLSMDIEKTTYLALIPYLACFAGSNLGGSVCDYLIARGFKVRTVRRGAVILGDLVPAVALIVAGFTANADFVIALLTISLGFNGLTQIGFACTPLDVAPHLSGVLMGVQNTIATLPGILAPLLTGDMVNNHNDALHWKEVFYLAGFLGLLGVVTYCVFMTDEVAPSLKAGYKGPWGCSTGVGVLQNEEEEEEERFKVAG